MSRKKRASNMLHSETKVEAARISLQKVNAKEVKSNSVSKFKNEIPKKKKKKTFKNVKRLYMHKMRNEIVSANVIKSKEALSNENIIPEYSGTEISMTTSHEENWIHEIEADISPSKSEHDTSINSPKIKVDTIYHTDNTTADNILSTLEDSYSKFNGDFDNFSLSNTIDESLEIESEEALHMICYDMKDGKVLVLKHRNPLYVHGCFTISILYGNVQILGHNLSPSSNEIEVYSLRGFSYLFIQNIHQGGYCTSDNTMRSKLRKYGVSKSDILNIASEIESGCSVLICTSISNLKLPYIEKHLSQKLLPATEDNFPLIFKDDISNLNTLIYNSQWDDIITMIDSTSKVMICGGKGVGKSTLLRYMINKLLRNFKEVLVIDLDPGQPEFTIPGCISALTIRKPIFGPNFTHLHKPERCIFIKNIDVTLEPDIYINSVIELLMQCEDLSGIPILINYMGYSHSYGINIVSSVITYVSPTVLLQINSAQRTKNFMEDLTPDTVMQHLDMFGGARIGELFYETITVDSMSDGLTSWLAQGRTIREMCILSYFSDILDSSLTLTSKNVPLYKIYLKDITLINNKSKSGNDKLAVFNANLVSLCSATKTENVFNCHGWGIVRGIDEKILVLLTPVCEDTLEIITHLSVGSVTLPPSMFMYEDTNVALVPYVSLGCISSFNYVPKRSYLSRKSN